MPMPSGESVRVLIGVRCVVVLVAELLRNCCGSVAGALQNGVLSGRGGEVLKSGFAWETQEVDTKNLTERMRGGMMLRVKALACGCVCGRECCLDCTVQ